ncbi:replication protein [Lactiplantibacillus plantarum]|uniref:hypothetical protein n=1 Tax=Lactiplantibacillus plantarum TaxID=1590 RepID=UPI0006D4B315|nr:hypothetical protein [Lactiplantibacillus plantarum]ALG27031.1 replication protein [Lactiplantibacillus plantarum]
MAQRRMFSNTITDSDLFMDMPKSAQLLYFHLNMHADDDGFVGNTKSIMRMTGSSDDDLKILLAKQYLIPFDNGVTVIKDWHIHNYIRSDRKHPTKYTSELKQLELNEDDSYSKLTFGSQVSTNGQPNDGHLVGNCHTEVRLGKDRLGKVSKDKVNKDSHHLAKPNYDPSSQPYKIASHLLTRIKQRQPDFKEPNLQKWANDIRLAHERDHRDYEKLDWLVDWSQDNSFWQANILSAGKLRKQYDTLIGQAERDRPTNVAPQTREDWFG